MNRLPIVDLHLPAVYMPCVHGLLWLLGVVHRTPVPSLLAMGALHSGQLNAQWPCRPECHSWLHGHFRSRLPLLRHRSQHCSAYLTLCQVL